METTTIIAIISTVVSVLTLLGFGTLTKMYWSDRHDKRKAQEKEQSEQHQLAEKIKRQAEIKEVLEATLEPLTELNKAQEQKLEKLAADMQMNSNGTIVILRDRMKCSLDFCKRQGFRSSADMANWMELYNAYKDLGGNHFKEFVNSWKEEMENLPTESELIKANNNHYNKDIH